MSDTFNKTGGTLADFETRGQPPNSIIESNYLRILPVELFGRSIYFLRFTLTPSGQSKGSSLMI
jgi:hypothetical protein